MENRFVRSEIIFGKDFVNILKDKRVIVFGAGGVGCGAIESLARSGVGQIDIADGDVYNPSNLNRQLYATEKTLGKNKATVAKERVSEIDSTISVNVYDFNFNKDNLAAFNLTSYDYIIDAIDSFNDKVLLIKTATILKVPIISSMGAGNKVEASFFEVSDVFKTAVCPLAKKLRTALKKEGVKKLKTVYSKEVPFPHERTTGSAPFVPPVAGFIMAGEVIKSFLNIKGKKGV